MIYWCERDFLKEKVYTIISPHLHAVLCTGDKSAPIPRETTLGELETEIKSLRAEIESIKGASSKVNTFKRFH